MSESIKEFIEGEKDFLHEISNQLIIAQGMGEILFRDLEDKVEKDSYDRLSHLKTAVETIIDLMRERRKLIDSIGRE